MADTQQAALEELTRTISEAYRLAKRTEGAVEVPYDVIDTWKDLGTATMPNQMTNDQLGIYTGSLIRLLLNKGPIESIHKHIVLLASQMKMTNDPKKLVINPTELELDTTYGGTDFSLPDPSPELGAGTIALHEYTTTFTELTRSKAHLWGPVFAILLMRCEKRNASQVVEKLRKMAINMKNLYSTPIDCPNFENRDLWIECLDRLNNNLLPESQKNTIFIGFILAYERPGAPNSLKGLLDFLILQSIRYTGMLIITLVEQVLNTFNCPAEVLMKLTFVSTTVQSWTAYGEMLNTYMRRLETITYL